MLRVLDYHSNNLHTLTALNYRCVGAFRSQGDGPRPKMASIKTQFCYIVTNSYLNCFLTAG